MMCLVHNSLFNSFLDSYQTYYKQSMNLILIYVEGIEKFVLIRRFVLNPTLFISWYCV